MVDLSTSFATLKLKNPFVVSSSGLTNSVAKNRKLAQSGAGAIVLKSLFEEQILMEVDHLQDLSYYGEGNEYMEAYIREHKLGEYLELIRGSKEACNIPIIASVNCYTDMHWVDFASRIQQAGADALEVNILALQTKKEYTYGSFEQHHVDILRHIKKTVSIPVIMKLGDNLTNPVALVNALYANGAAAVVLFNRFYQPDINIDTMEHISADVLAPSGSLSNTLRWIGIASAMVQGLDYAASGGVATKEAVVKALLAGASAVEVCGALYKKGNSFIAESLGFLSSWMESKGYKSISGFKGKLNVKDLEGVNMFERTQFLKYYSSHAG